MQGCSKNRKLIINKILYLFVLLTSTPTSYNNAKTVIIVVQCVLCVHYDRDVFATVKSTHLTVGGSKVTKLHIVDLS